jgi:hypothetical protein
MRTPSGSADWRSQRRPGREGCQGCELTWRVRGIPTARGQVIVAYVRPPSGIAHGVVVVVASGVGGRAREGDAGEEFRISLPLVGDAVTHVVELRGDEAGFMDALAAAVQSGGDEVDPLLLPVAATSLGKLADVLNRLGDVSVQSIDPLPNLGE